MVLKSLFTHNNANTASEGLRTEAVYCYNYNITAECYIIIGRFAGKPNVTVNTSSIPFKDIAALGATSKKAIIWCAD